MSRHRARVAWALQAGEDFLAGRYSRGHAVTFEGGHAAPGTASRHVVGNRWSAPGAVDPEEMLVAAASACHMLTFLHKAREAGFVVASYEDKAEGELGPDAEGRLAVRRIVLRPSIDWSGPEPDAAALANLHHLAHEECFIARAVRCEIAVEPPRPDPPAAG